MATHDWDGRYLDGDTPWDTGEPDPHLVALTEDATIGPCRVLEVGCGTGTNALWLSARGFEVTGVDLSSRAIDQALRKAQGCEGGERVSLQVADFLHGELPPGAFDLVFDRGVFHVFDEAADRLRFAERVATVLEPGGRWLSLAGSTEGPAREHGPPRRSARDLVMAVEPHLELVDLRSVAFAARLPSPARAWLMLARRREVAAQPSTKR
ncbi:MAG: class I SAM-dependent methyltransferase [Myxococcales bacterium]|nr:class I SAM-dependent methyltransferase [Myxococcales bacterium]MCB9713634.1 class I SAM-dependent methyltransferase [Myxococcales bacterium]